jgi:Tol biopolymer transport system component
MPDGALVCTHSRTLLHPDDQIGPTYRVTFDGLERTVVPVPESDEVYDVSPDGRWLLTTSGRHAPQRVGYQTYLIAIDGSEERRLTPDGFNLFPRFTPDGRHVIFTRAQGKLSAICRMNLDGSGLTTLISGLSPDAKARPTPDGSHLLVHERTRLFLTDAEGRNPRPIPVSCRPLGMPIDVEPLCIGAAEWVAK